MMSGKVSSSCVVEGWVSGCVMDERWVAQKYGSCLVEESGNEELPINVKPQETRVSSLASEQERSVK